MVHALVFKINAAQTVDFDGCLAIIPPVTNDDWKFECDIKNLLFVTNVCLMNEWPSFHHPLYVFLISCLSNKENL